MGRTRRQARFPLLAYAIFHFGKFIPFSIILSRIFVSFIVKKS